MNKYLGPAVLLATLSLYIFTACPTIYPGDSGEIVSAAYCLGIPHPPGYPLYTMLGHISIFIPAGSIAFRVNLLAGLFGGLGALLLYIFLKELGKKFYGNRGRAAAAVSALILAFSLTYWQQCTQAKGGIYTLNILLLISMFYCVLTEAPVAATAVITGLALANHNTMAPIAFAAFLYIVFAGGEKAPAGRGRKALLFPLVSLATAAALYLYLPIRSAAHPAMDWGNPENASNFFRHIFREQYGTVAETERSLGLFLRQTAVYLKSLASQFAVLPALMGIAGAYMLAKRAGAFSLFLISVLLLTSIGFLLLTNFSINSNNIYMINVFYIPSYLVLLIFMYAFIMELQSVKPVIWAAGLSAAASLALNFGANDRSNNYIAYDFGMATLRSAGHDSMLTVAGDSTAFTTAYLRMVEKKAPDIGIYDDYGLIFSHADPELEKIPQSEYFARLEYVKKLALTRKPSFFVLGSSLHKEVTIYKGLGASAEPDGTLFRLVRRGEKFTRTDPSRFVLRGLDSPSTRGDFLARSMEAQYFYFCGEHFRAVGRTKEAEGFYTKAKETGYDDQTMLDLLGALYQEQGNIGSAIEAAKKAVDLDPYSPEMWNNYGSALSKAGRNEESRAAYEKAVKLDGKIVTYHNNLAAALYNLGRPKEALDEYNRAAGLNASGLDYYGLGMTLLKLNDSKQAEDVFRKGLEANPSAEVYFGLGNLLLNSGRTKEAEAAYLDGLKLNPVHDRIYTNLGVAYCRAGEMQKGIEAYRNAVRINPGNLDAMNNLAISLYNLGKKDESIRLWKRMLEIDPNNKTAKDLLEKVK